MKLLNWKKILLIVFVVIGLLYITRMVGMTPWGSFFMSFGILILLLLVDALLAQYERNRRKNGKTD
ncbi:MAG: hypothetical protein LKG25_04310 [Prevotella sp.]|nr:hypothetical protein [Prevotella sp.]MCI1281798.1 hypothetical protein [Prevotella sp.]